MDELIKTVVDSAPNVIGLVLAVYLIQRTNERLLDELFDRISKLEVRIEEIARDISQ